MVKTIKISKFQNRTETLYTIIQYTYIVFKNFINKINYTFFFNIVKTSFKGKCQWPILSLVTIAVCCKNINLI